MAIPKKVHTFGTRFSQDVRSIFISPKKAVQTIINESELAHSLSVPLIVVIISAILGVIGKYLWLDITSEVSQAVFGGSVLIMTLMSIMRGFLLTIALIAMPIIMLIAWVFWAVVFHFIGSIMSGKDITEVGIFHKTLKLTGFTFAPLFLNIIYPLSHITGYWSVLIAFYGMRANYKTTDTGAFIIILPYLFTVAYGSFGLVTKLAVA